ncbi:hypothetical protein GCM10010275_55100 [Streptomyces litmocidini]|nr:hypothetical protein GCM10010275_55100 [Streptomyces litmocidini]
MRLPLPAGAEALHGPEGDVGAGLGGVAHGGGSVPLHAGGGLADGDLARLGLEAGGGEEALRGGTGPGRARCPGAERGGRARARSPGEVGGRGRGRRARAAGTGGVPSRCAHPAGRAVVRMADTLSAGAEQGGNPTLRMMR